MKLQIANASKSYGAQDVLTKASLEVKNNEKIALVGRNGSGKTTLLKLITGQEDLDSGERFIASNTRIGYLEQITFPDESRSVLQELQDVFKPLLETEKALKEQAKVLETDHSQAQLEKYDRLQSKFDALGGYDYEFEMRAVFFHFGFGEEDLNRPLKEFSSGQRTRIALVKLLLEKPDVLLLDEPTNHLDLESIEWLESYIARYPSAVVLVSHDRMFLDRVADEIIEIEFGKTTRYPGSYTHYVKAKEEWLATNHEAFLRQQKEIERLNALIEKFRYKASKASFAQSKIKYLDRMERIEDARADTSIMKASFTPARKSGSRVLETENLQVGYDSVLSDVTMELFGQNRMAIVGPNGTGKSTLLKTLIGQLAPLGGYYHYGHHVDIGYFDQDSAQMKSDKTVLDELWDQHPDADQKEIRSVLARFLFRQDEVFKEVSALSGGERVRLALASLMMSHDNLLILDEPTNHLDIPAREALETALKDFEGTLLFVSHDRMFLSKMADRVLELDRHARIFQATYDEYVQKKNEGRLSDLVQNEFRQKKKKEPAKPAELTPAQLRAKEKSLSNRVAKLEQLVAAEEQRKESLEELRYEPEYYQDYQKMEELQQDIDACADQIEAYMKEWEEKMSELEGIAQG